MTGAEKESGLNRVHPKGENRNSDGENDEYDEQNHNSEAELGAEDLKAPKEQEQEEKDGDQFEESEWKDKYFRVYLEKFINHSFIGDMIQKLIGLISIVTTVSFIFMTFLDPKNIDPCCVDPPACPELEPDCINYVYTCVPECKGTCTIPCTEFYYSRMPKTYEMIDILVCLVYMVHYFITLFISQNRFAHFMSLESANEMIIIIPVLFFSWDCDQLGLFLKAVSRMLRMNKLKILIQTKETNEDSNVNN